MASTADIKNGVVLNIDGQLWSVVEFQHVKPGKGGAFVRTKLRNVTSGKVVHKTFNAGAKIETATVDRRDATFLYRDGTDFVFMDSEDFEQHPLPEALVGRLAPLEARLAEVDPAGALDRFAERLEAVQGRVAQLEAVENPFTEISDQLTRLYAQKDAGLAQVLERLAPLEARLSGLEARPWDPAGEEARDEARAQAQAIAAQMIAARTASDQVAAQTGLFADRLALLEASLPRLSAAQATLMQALEARTLAMAAPAIAAASAWGLQAPLSDPARWALNRLALKARQVGARQDLIREGDKPENVLLILDGFACRYKVLPDGQRQIMALLVPGDHETLIAALEAKKKA